MALTEEQIHSITEDIVRALLNTMGKTEQSPAASHAAPEVRQAVAAVLQGFSIKPLYKEET